ncbi:hypothetical protein FA13DRAFT_1687117 [Coprinellus micaceus]|uniref:Uncharacterized protein n=1 Tax=Coprinellus micaceus TaxID=71717 RepID=A0A4Y7TED5_COPMI|nr:hypothetical protein FA13DRAFT_1687117 [Coprinellus micaceus]
MGVGTAIYTPGHVPGSPSSDSEAGGSGGPFTSEVTTPLTPKSPDAPLIEQKALEDVPLKKKKKKKKPKKKPKASAQGKEQEPSEPERKPPVLCISRNKHWRYISSYHGPWLQLPLELLESLLMLNSDPTTLSSETRMAQLLPPLIGSTVHTHTSNSSSSSSGNGKQREHLTLNPHDRDFTPPESPSTHITIPALPPASFPTPKPGKPSPPPIDPGVFRSVTSIRSYIDEAAELSVRASSGLSAAELGSMRNGASLNSPWAAAQSLGLNPLGMPNGGGRNVAMSAMRIHRLRALAVQKLAAAYKADEIASSVMVMQGGSVFDDVAERVLKVDPNDSDAKYVHFFHEKIPSRQLAESTTTKVLDELIAKHPQRLEYYRTRGVVHCFREEFSAATKDFTYALKEARAVRRAKMMHHPGNTKAESRPSKSKRRKGSGKSNANGQAPPSGTSAMDDDYASGSDGCNVLHPSVLPEAPEPIEPQCLFLRGAAYLQQAVHLIEGAVLGLEGVRKAPTIDGAELRLCYIENGKYGGVEIGNPEGPLGSSSGAKARAYNAVLGEKSFRDHITTLLKKSLRDHEKFLSHFDSLESPTATPSGDIASQVDYAYTLADTKRGSPDIPPVFTTYHPLLVESSYSALICHLMLADFASLLPQFVRTAIVVDGLEGYPVFLPPRSMGQAEFLEILDRLAGGWKLGTRPHSLSAQRGKCRLASEGPPPSPFPALPLSRSSSLANSLADDRPGSSSSSRKNSFAMGSSSMTFTSGGNSQTTPKSLADLDASRCTSPLPSPTSTSTSTTRVDASHALDCARILLAPVVKRRQEKAEKERQDRLSGAKKKPAPISIPLHGPRVEVVLAWLGAVHLPELEE